MSSEGPASASASVATATTARRALFALGLAITVAFLIIDLVLPTQTSLAPEALIVAGAVWFAASLAAGLWALAIEDDHAPFRAWFSLVTLFYAVVVATFTIHALDNVSTPPEVYNPNEPEALAGLATDFTPYYLVLLASTVLFVTWYGRRRERETEAGVAVLIVCSSLAFELMLRIAGSRDVPFSGNLSMPLLWGTLLVLAGLWLTNERPRGLTWRWTPAGGAIGLLLVAGFLSTAASVYVHGSLLMFSRIAAFAALFWLIANTITGERQVRLYWLAFAGPLAGAALVIVLHLVDLGREMGFDFVLLHRYQISGIAGTNPLGLFLGVGVLFVAGGLVVERAWPARAALVLALILLVPAFLATHSPTGIIALIAALLGLAVLRYGYGLRRLGRRALEWRAAAALGGGVLLFVLLFVPNPYSSKVLGDVQDPSAGRSARPLAWQLTVRDIQHNPVFGVGLGNYYARSGYVDDFPARSMTGVRERRSLLGATIEPWKNFVSFHPHNGYLALVEGVGVLGVAAFAWLGGALALEAWFLFRRADSSARWWSAAVALAGTGMALFWSFFAQGEDVTNLALPLWPMLGLYFGARRLFAPSIDGLPSVERLARARDAVPARLRPAARYAAPAFAAIATIAFVVLVARPVAAEVLVAKSDESVETDAARALDLARWAERVDPWNAGFAERVAGLRLRTGDLEGAVAAQEHVVDLRRRNAPDVVRLGWFYWLARSPEAAGAEFQRAVDLDPWDTTRDNVYVPLALALANAGRLDEATQALATGLQLSPNIISDEAWVLDADAEPPDWYLDTVYMQRGEGSFPMELQRALVRRLGQPGSRHTPGAVDGAPTVRMSDVLDAMYADYQTTLARDRDEAVSKLENLGELALQLERPEQAAGYLEELAQLSPDESFAHYALGLAYADLRRLEPARQAFERTVAIGDDSGEYDVRVPFAHFQLGVLALRRSDSAAAEASFREALDTYRWEYMPRLYINLGVAQALRGDTAEAEDSVRKELFLLGIDADGAPPATEERASR